MSVNPGFGGQSFIENTYKKKKSKKNERRKRSNFIIEVDGGVNSNNAKTNLLDAGADILVAGSFVFKSENPIKTIENLKNYLAI